MARRIGDPPVTGRSSRRSNNNTEVNGTANVGWKDPMLSNRIGYANASVAIHHIEKGRARGYKPALWLRSVLQEELFQLGRLIQQHAGKVLFVGIIILGSLSIGLKSARLEDKIEKLWVEEGGRLEQELAYVDKMLGQGAGGINQMLIQTIGDDSPKGHSLLRPQALLRHLELLKRATRVTVQRDDVTWKLADLCYKPTIPSTEIPLVEQILDKLFPCAIITPLDCFWEGSKLLGPDYPIRIPMGGENGSSQAISWSSLHPVNLMEQMKTAFTSFPFQTFQDYMKRSGINSGYQEKPCLDPYDPECPASAPNKVDRRPPDIGAELTGGCSGFATRFMNWPEQLIVGGTVKNASGYIQVGAALQSVVQIMGSRDMYNYWSNTYKVHAQTWNVETAAMILEEFQEKFEAEVIKGQSEFSGGHNHQVNDEDGLFYAYSSLGLQRVMSQFSRPSIINLIIGYVVMTVYTCVSLYSCADRVRSRAGLGLAGVILVTITILAGMGLSALIGQVFTAATTQILPFLALGLGVNSLFLLIHTFSGQVATDIPCEDQVGEVLRKAGLSVLTTGICNMAAFLAASLIPLPAMRSFCQQAALLTGLNLFSMLILFPAMIALDVRRLFSSKMDLFCCFAGDGQTATGGDRVDAELAHNANNEKMRHSLGLNNGPKAFDRRVGSENGTASDLLNGLNGSDAVGNGNQTSTASRCSRFGALSRLVGMHYANWITGNPAKVMTLVAALAVIGASAWGINRLEDGLELTDIVPANTTVARFLAAEDRYFGFYTMYAVTEGNFEYPQNQALLHDYHNAFVRVKSIIKDDNGGLPDFWLSSFRSWLLRLQDAYDNDFARGYINSEGWKAEASDDAVLAYKLLVQTGHVDYPVDKSLLLTPAPSRLVSSDGIINPEAFYNYLSAWYTNDPMAYSFSQASIVPTPKTWYSDRADHNLRIPKSKPIRYAQIPFMLHGLGGTPAIVETVKSVREVCRRFAEDGGLPNFPNGIPFTFWEQYLGLRRYLSIALGAALGAIFLAVSCLFVSVWAGGVAVLVVGLVVAELFGFLGVVGVKLSAVPSVILIVGVGLGVEFTIHILTSFVGTLGDRRRRAMLALEHMFVPVVQGALSTLIGVIMLAFSEFDFIFRYFFLVLLALIMLGLFNGLAFLPVLMVIIGPPANLVSLTEDPDVLPPASPLPSPARPSTRSNGSVRGHSSTSHHLVTSGRGSERRSRSSGGSGGKRHGTASIGSVSGLPFNSGHRSNSLSAPKRHNSDISLSTIAEESHSHQSSYASNASSYSVSSDSYNSEERPETGYSQPPPAASMPATSLGGTSVFLEPHITVETSTIPACGSGSSSNCSTPTSSLGGNSGSMGGQGVAPAAAGQVTKVTATAKFKLELHTPTAAPSATVMAGNGGGGGGHNHHTGSGSSSRRSRRRGSSGSSSGGGGSLPAAGQTILLPPAHSQTDLTRSSIDSQSGSEAGGVPLPNSLASSLSSDGGFSEK